jgi:methylenetetrahydrofolate dehydrogenase (NADP+)/methenyltetrahydrofolate cyclohydrolase
VILVGQDPASQVYVRNKILRAEEAGIRSLEYRLSADTPQAELLALIGELNSDKSINGILLQLPLRRNPRFAGHRAGQGCRWFSQ